MAWLSCRRAGIPARLILETDGVAEEISFWFRPSQNGDRSAAPSQHPPRRGRTKRRRRAKRRRVNRFGQASPIPSSQVCPVATAVAPASFPEVTAPPAESRNMSPPAKSPPAKRPRTRAAARSGFIQGHSTPETSRAVAEGSLTMLDLSLCSPPTPTPEGLKSSLGGTEPLPMDLPEESVSAMVVCGGLDLTDLQEDEATAEGDASAAEGGFLHRTVEEAGSLPQLQVLTPPAADAHENLTGDMDSMGSGGEYSRMKRSAVAEVQEFLWAWAENGYLEKELEEGVRSRGGWSKVYDIIFPVLPPVPMRCRFCKDFDVNMGYDDDLCTETDDHCGKCTMAEEIDMVKNFAFSYCSYSHY